VILIVRRNNALLGHARGRGARSGRRSVSLSAMKKDRGVIFSGMRSNRRWGEQGTLKTSEREKREEQKTGSSGKEGGFEERGAETEEKHEANIVRTKGRGRDGEWKWAEIFRLCKGSQGSETQREVGGFERFGQGHRAKESEL